MSVLWHCGSRSWNDGKGFNGLISRKAGISNETMVTEKRQDTVSYVAHVFNSFSGRLEIRRLGCLSLVLSSIVSSYASEWKRACVAVHICQIGGWVGCDKNARVTCLQTCSLCASGSCDQRFGGAR